VIYREAGMKRIPEPNLSLSDLEGAQGTTSQLGSLGSPSRSNDWAELIHFHYPESGRSGRGFGVHFSRELDGLLVGFLRADG